MAQNEQKVQNWKIFKLQNKKVQNCEVSLNLNYRIVQTVSQCAKSQVLMHVIIFGFPFNYYYLIIFNVFTLIMCLSILIPLLVDIFQITPNHFLQFNP
jgi:hypothetical protein